MLRLVAAGNGWRCGFDDSSGTMGGRDWAQTSGTIIHFNDVTKASERRIRVEYTAADGVARQTFAAVDHDQHPVVGTSVTVVYADSDPGRAVVSGYEYDGVWLRGAGVVLTVAFVLPAGVTAETAPVPADPKVRIRAVPGSLRGLRPRPGTRAVLLRAVRVPEFL